MMLKLFRPIFSTRFLKFCAVGASGVIVNLGCLALFARAIGIQANLAAAMAIEISIVTNFLINEAWTFRDRRSKDAGIAGRLLKFHVVSVVGAAIQWVIFVAGNAAAATMLEVPAGVGEGGWLDRWIVAPVVKPADVGDWMYLSQLTGIAVATLWNFFANFYWTWKHGPRERTDG